VPFLRVIRDKRGYETTYLMHWYREGSRQRSRILYVFRTPGGVRVGRHPLDADVQRQLEARHPDIAFDWTAVREHQQVVEPVIDQRRRKPRRTDVEDGGVQKPEPALAPRPEGARDAEPVPPRHAPVPPVIQGSTPEAQMAFLVEWYQRICERIPHLTASPDRRETLRALADRLNPAAWTDADQVAAGLQQAAEALERLSHVFARRRRRARRGPGRPEGTGGRVSGSDTDGSRDNGSSES
jgi:hypothetical protein